MTKLGMAMLQTDVDQEILLLISGFAGLFHQFLQQQLALPQHVTPAQCQQHCYQPSHLPYHHQPDIPDDLQSPCRSKHPH